MDVSNETESELIRIRDENDSVRRVMSEISLDSDAGRADPMEVDREAVTENSGTESTEGRKLPYVLIGTSCEEKGAADVPIANDAATTQSDGSARRETTMTPIPPVREHCGGQTSPGCYLVADGRLKGDSRSGQSTSLENPSSRSCDADILRSSSISRRMQHDTSDDGDDGRSGRAGPGWNRDPVQTTTESDPSVTTAEAVPAPMKNLGHHDAVVGAVCTALSLSRLKFDRVCWWAPTGHT
ncbi:hypothetical protein LTR53_002313 [Teratosphaeriaceae sp. CCFEE 6253]|nr:hypothetical protein LTR53_002313 [Teratosphaeriaceae sp. CCFEE 6253]